MNKTQNFSLNQWEKTDRIMMEDFNADNLKIEAALSGMLKMASGSYTGNGEAEQFIPLSFTPKAVFVCRYDSLIRTTIEAADVSVEHEDMVGTYYNGGLAVQGAPASVFDRQRKIVEIVEGGFKVFWSEIKTIEHVNANQKSTVHHYLALG